MFFYTLGVKKTSRYDTKSKNLKEKTDIKLCDNTNFKTFIEKSQNTKTAKKIFLCISGNQ